MGDHTAFFYGESMDDPMEALMAPQVLHRVIYGHPDPEPWQSKLLTIKPAILHDFCRHKVRHCDYPAILPQVGSTVRGTYVTGLTQGDIWRLDIFEGSEYARKKVKVRLLAKVGDVTGEGNVEGEEVDAETYVWIAGENTLEPGEWDFAVFVKEKMARYLPQDYDVDMTSEVDEAVQSERLDPTGGRGLNGDITSKLNSGVSSDEMQSAV